MRYFVCVYQPGGGYTEEDVHVLRRQVLKSLPSTDEFFCFTNEKIRGVKTIPLELNLRGKYSMVEVFRKTGTVIATGLDTVFTADIDFIWEVLEAATPHQFYAIEAFASGAIYANGMMGWNGDWSNLFYDYQNPKKYYKYRLEQRYTFEKLKEKAAEICTFNEHLDIKSFKKHCRNGLPYGTEVVLFHGKPRPSQVSDTWVTNRRR